MCGIVGYVGQRPAVDLLVRGLKRLEYRGYDSAGVAFFRDGKIEVRKSEGKLENVERILEKEGIEFTASHCGIGHTRWATHGKPTTQNAHPHRAGHIALVHNGIIENYQEIKKDLLALGYKPQSETDSELFGFLVLDLMKKGQTLVEAIRESFKRVEGACSVVVISEQEPGVVVGVRNGSPLVAAADPKGGAIVASDAQAILEITRDVVFLEQGDLVVGSEKGIEFFEVTTGKPVKRAATHLDWSVDKLDKQGFPHFMLKEIYEQPTALVDTLNGMLDRLGSEPFRLAPQPAVDLLENAREIIFVACGSSWHAALLAKYWFEKWAGIPAHVDYASEFRYRSPVLGPGQLVIGITQSGETADTLAAMRSAKDLKIPTLAITNVRGSTVTREADAALFTFAGPEIGVASTKAFLTQLVLLLGLAGGAARKRKTPGLERVFEDLVRVPHVLSSALAQGSLVHASVKAAAKELSKCKGFFFIGRGYSFPIALEGALKLKEIAYLHAEGYAAGELKHGPIAMIDKDFAVVVLAPKDRWRDKTVSNLEEVRARGAVILGIGDSHDDQLKTLCNHWLPVPGTEGRGTLEESVIPLAITPLVQLLSYEIALLKGTDVDKPRNLAKSVTVE